MWNEAFNELLVNDLTSLVDLITAIVSLNIECILEKYYNYASIFFNTEEAQHSLT